MPNKAAASQSASPQPTLKQTLSKKTRRIGVQREDSAAVAVSSVFKRDNTHQLVRVAANQTPHHTKATANQGENKIKLKDVVAALPSPSSSPSSASSSSRDDVKQLKTVYFNKTAFDRLTGTSTATDDVRTKPWESREGPIQFKHVVSASKAVLNKKRRLIDSKLAMSESTVLALGKEEEEALLRVRLELDSEEETDLRRGSTPQAGGRNLGISLPDNQELVDGQHADNDNFNCSTGEFQSDNMDMHQSEDTDRPSQSACSVRTVYLPLDDPAPEINENVPADDIRSIRRAWDSASATRTPNNTGAAKQKSKPTNLQMTNLPSNPVKLTIIHSPAVNVHKQWLSTPDLRTAAWRKLTEVEWNHVMIAAQKNGFFLIA